MPHDLDRAIAEALTAQGLNEDLAWESFVSCPGGHKEHDLVIKEVLFSRR